MGSKFSVIFLTFAGNAGKLLHDVVLSSTMSSLVVGIIGKSP